jgi:two-component system response regulator AlgR
MTDILRILVVDDEPLAVERMQILLARSSGVQLVGTAGNGLAAVRLAELLSPDLLLLDIAMPDLDGMDVARSLGKLEYPPKVVFVTAYDSFAVAAFDVQAVDYLMKPIDPARLEKALQRVREALASNLAAAPRPQYLGEFWASDHVGLTRIRAEDVDRIIAERDYMRIHVGKRSWLINHSLSKLEQELDPHQFVRLHRSAIVRRNFVIRLQHADAGWIACLADGSEQRVGRAFADNARKLSGRDKLGR